MKINKFELRAIERKFNITKLKIEIIKDVIDGADIIIEFDIDGAEIQTNEAIFEGKRGLIIERTTKVISKEIEHYKQYSKKRYEEEMWSVIWNYMVKNAKISDSKKKFQENVLSYGLVAVKKTLKEEAREYIAINKKATFEEVYKYICVSRSNLKRKLEKKYPI